MIDWEPGPRERLTVASAGLDWSRSILRRSRDHLREVPRERLAPLVEELTAAHERLGTLQRLFEIISREGRSDGNKKVQ
jgi:hypothetical protein